LHALGQDNLIFASDQDGQSLDVFSMDLDGNTVSNITQTPDSNEIPIAWSPDAGHVIFASDRGGASEIFIVEPSSAGLLNLSERDAAQSFDDWSAETGQLILTSVSDLGPSLLITDLDGGTQQTLTDGSYPAGGGNWSPDGQKVAFMAIGPESSTLDIFVVDVSGGEPVNLTQSPSNESFPRWSPDGSKIALGDFSWSPDGAQILFHSDRDNDVEIYVMDADGGNQVNLTNSPGTDYFSIWVK
jgi:Tol biopolymer transport system component